MKQMWSDLLLLWMRLTAAGTISVDDISVDNPYYNPAAIVNGACALTGQAAIAAVYHN
jgi:hypothetical protein